MVRCSVGWVHNAEGFKVSIRTQLLCYCRRMPLPMEVVDNLSYGGDCSVFGDSGVSEYFVGAVC